MNKSQELAIMQLRAKMKIKELLEQHDVAWNGQEPKMVDEVDDGDKTSE